MIFCQSRNRTRGRHGARRRGAGARRIGRPAAVPGACRVAWGRGIDERKIVRVIIGVGAAVTVARLAGVRGRGGIKTPKFADNDKSRLILRRWVLFFGANFGLSSGLRVEQFSNFFEKYIRLVRFEQNHSIRRVKKIGVLKNIVAESGDEQNRNFSV